LKFFPEPQILPNIHRPIQKQKTKHPPTHAQNQTSPRQIPQHPRQNDPHPQSGRKDTTTFYSDNTQTKLFFKNFIRQKVNSQNQVAPYSRNGTLAGISIEYTAGMLAEKEKGNPLQRLKFVVGKYRKRHNRIRHLPISRKSA
jgi:hypothetical protein